MKHLAVVLFLVILFRKHIFTAHVEAAVYGFIGTGGVHFLLNGFTAHLKDPMSRPCYVMLQIMVSWWLELGLSVMVVIDLYSMHQLWGKETICKLLLDIANKSILVIEDTDCIVNLGDCPWVRGRKCTVQDKQGSEVMVNFEALKKLEKAEALKKLEIKESREPKMEHKYLKKEIIPCQSNIMLLQSLI
ncbi:hypothetical protein V6N13_127050 [Hibiscus sabdariffa]|uniref:Uncharacterized protein n=1 Tax=Hibiscus sabdariffa TaxID=183260 RepID=A0ABR2RDN5_9ROSI